MRTRNARWGRAQVRRASALLEWQIRTDHSRRALERHELALQQQV
jgi:hypothetical protein